MRRLRLTTAGESHGPGLTATLQGLPAGLRVDVALLARDLARRQHGFGRGRRMQIEADAAEIRGGVRGGVTLGSPVVLWIANRDYANWEKVMGPAAEDIDPRLAELRRLKAPRPGHADLAGGPKFLRRGPRGALPPRCCCRSWRASTCAAACARLAPSGRTRRLPRGTTCCAWTTARRCAPSTPRSSPRCCGWASAPRTKATPWAAR